MEPLNPFDTALREFLTADEIQKNFPEKEKKNGKKNYTLNGNLSENKPDKNRVGFMNQLANNMTAPDWVLWDFIERNSMACLFAPPGHGKTFVALDIAASVATGSRWCGHETTQTTVCYVIGEGKRGFERRARGWEIKNRIRFDDYNMMITNGGYDFFSPLNTGEFIQHCEARLSERNITTGPGLVVIDTVSRCFSGGDENSTRDMTAFIRNLDSIRERWKCAVLLVHHCGHGSRDRARGSSALLGAVDCEFKTEKRDGVIQFSATKTRDGNDPDPICFELRPVELGINDQRGNPVTSAVLERTDKPLPDEPEKPPAPRLTGNHEAIMQAIRMRTENGELVTRQAVRDDLKCQGMDVHHFSRHLNKLLQDGLVTADNDILKLVDIS